MGKTLSAILVAAALVAAHAAPLPAAPVRKVIPFSVAVPLASGTYYFHFSLWSAASPVAPGTMTWSEERRIAVQGRPVGGTYRAALSHQLGSVNPFDAPRGYAPVDFSQQWWVAVAYRTSPQKPWTILPGRRQALTVAPYALWSGSVAADSVTSAQILDGSISAADIRGGPGSGLDADRVDGRHGSDLVAGGQVDSVTSPMIVNGTVRDEDVAAAAAIADTKLGRIESPGKVADSALSANVALLDAAQTVTGVKEFNPAAGDAPFAVGPAKRGLVANLHAETADRVGGLSVADLDARYGAPPAPAGMLQGYLRTTVTDVAARVCSVAIGVDGFPLVVYQPYEAGGTVLPLYALHCTDPACSGPRTISTLTAQSNGCQASIAIGTDGLPLVAFVASPGFEEFDLGVIHCGNVGCSAGNTVQGLLIEGSVSGPSLAIGTDGLPVIASIAGTDPNYDLTVAHCSTADCSAWSAHGIASYCDANDRPSLAIGADGLPVISFYTFASVLGPQGLKVAHCADRACSSGVSVATVDAAAGEVTGESSAIAVGGDGLPVVSYSAYYSGTFRSALRVAHCGNLTCTAGTTRAMVEADCGLFFCPNSIAVGAGGVPVIVYTTYPGEPPYLVKTMHCGGADCSSGNSVSSAISDSESRAVIATGTDGLPVVVYMQEAPDRFLTLAKGFRRPFGR